jgi:glycosyltransferase involved in cell wall biosynthesis
VAKLSQTPLAGFAHDWSTVSKLTSVIIPAYNCEKYLATALDSIVAQDYGPVDIVVVDDGSTDATACIARSYSGVRYIYQPHQGLPAARNNGLANCTGELICFLDGDDYWPSNKLRLQGCYLAAHPELGCVIGKLLNFLHDGMARPHWISEPLMTEEGGGWSLGASLVQRWVFDRVGPFDVAYSYCDDLDWLIRMAEARVPWAVIPGVFLHRRIHTSNMSCDRNAVARAEFLIMKAHMDRIRGKVASFSSEVTAQLRPAAK